jgi:hypothetical protein
VNKRLGQGYDCAANMSGIYLAVQAKRERNAEYVPCAARNLNVALSDCVQNISEIRNFMTLWNSFIIFLATVLNCRLC